MNSQKYKIQALIAEIDEVLSKPAPRLPWTGSIDTVHQRHLLERVRTYLVSQDSQLPAGKKPPSNPNLPPTPVRVPPPPPRPPQPPAARPSDTDRIVLAVTEEIGNLRENLTQPLQDDIQALRQEQQALVEEIKQLEARRQQQQSLAQQQANQQQIISEFMQALTGQLQEAFARSVSPIGGNLPGQQLVAGSATPALGAASDSGLEAGERASEFPLLTPSERFEQMQQFQARADSLMMRLDSTLNVVFETLQDNLQNYQESLEQGLDRMHGLGQQSEAMFAAWVNRLAQQLGRETYSWAQGPIDLTGREADAPRPIDPTAADQMLPNTDRSDLDETPMPHQTPENRDEITEQDRLPYAGSEISPQFGQLRRDRTPTEISLPDLEENLFGTEPIGQTMHQPPEPETDDSFEDVYASLFATEEIAELELEPFVLENTETAASIASEFSQTPEEPPTAEPLTAENLFANLTDDSESLGDLLAGEGSDFVIANSVEELTLDTQNFDDLQVAAPQISESEPQISESEVPTAELQIDRGDRSTAAPPPPPQQSDAGTTAPEIPPPPAPAPELRMPSARDVQTGEFSLESDDFYIHASPDENLLPSADEPQASEDRSIDLDNNTLQQLEADLYSLEGLETSEPGGELLELDVSDGGTDNPFDVDAGEESGTLDDLFADVLAVSPSDEAFSLEAELDAELFAESEDPNVTLDDILATLNQAETDPVRVINPESGTAGETLPDSQKKKLISIDPPETAADDVTAATAPAFPFSETRSSFRSNSKWYLGIDFGTTGLSAALLDREGGQLYPIFWEPQQHSETLQAEVPESTAIFRMPPAAVLTDTRQSAGCRESSLQNFKLPLKVGIPYLREVGGVYEPVFQQSQRAVSIALPLQGLRALLASLHPSEQPPLAENTDAKISVSDYTCNATGLDRETLRAALLDLEGVILGGPAGWSDAYRFNLREAVLGAGLVSSSSQIFVVEDAIATLLSAVTPIDHPNSIESDPGESVAGDRQSAPLTLHPSSFSGGTLIINAGATTVELALVDLPENIQDLTSADFACQSFEFGGDAFDRDIICQLLAKNESLGMTLVVPRPGYPDLADRYKLEQQLQNSELGLQLLAAAKHLKVILQHQDSFILEVDRHRWEVKRRDLETEVLVPFVQQLNRELNALLSRVGMSPARINQAFCTGGMGSWPAIGRWLRQKLPNAIVVQDSELEGDRPFKNTNLNNFNFKTCRVACGLASLALYPQILDLPRQQYSDFFLLWELMQVMEAEILSFDAILQLLQCAGVNTRNCESRILEILEGKLPDGMVPLEADLILFTEESRQNPDWEEILTEPLFFQEVPAGYRLNVEHAAVVRKYLGKIASDKQQKLLEPLTVAWDCLADSRPLWMKETVSIER